MATTRLLARWVTVETDALERAGFEAGAYLSARGFPPNSEPGWSRIPWSIVPPMWQAAVKHTGDRSLGLHAAAALPLVRPGFVAYAMMSGANLADSFQFLEQYQTLCINAHIVSLEQRRDAHFIGLDAPLRPTPTDQHAEFLFLLFVRAARFMLGSDFAPAEICLRRDEPSSSSDYQQQFSCPVRFREPRDTMRVDASWMLRPSPFSHPETMQTLRERATQFLSEHTVPDWASRVEALVERLLPEGEATMQHVARRLGTTPRTLQRRLAAEGQTFDRIRDVARRGRSLELVDKADMPMARVASDVGLSSPRALRRAVRRWTGSAPSRRAAKDAGTK